MSYRYYYFSLAVERPGLYIYRGHVDLLGLLIKISLSWAFWVLVCENWVIDKKVMSIWSFEFHPPFFPAWTLSENGEKPIFGSRLLKILQTFKYKFLFMYRMGFSYFWNSNKYTQRQFQIQRFWATKIAESSLLT